MTGIDGFTVFPPRRPESNDTECSISQGHRFEHGRCIWCDAEDSDWEAKTPTATEVWVAGTLGIPPDTLLIERPAKVDNRALDIWPPQQPPLAVKVDPVEEYARQCGISTPKEDKL
jgi:hypothetical protein